SQISFFIPFLEKEKERREEWGAKGKRNQGKRGLGKERSEASHLISKSPVNEAPKSLLSLGDMLHEYICLKEHKDLINAYTHAAPPPILLRPPLSAAAAAAPTVNNTATPVMMSTSKTLAEASNFSTPTASTSQSQSQPCLKRSRNNSKHVPSSKRTRTQPLLKSVKPPPPQAAAAATASINQDNTLQITPLPSNTALSPVQVQGSSVAKCLFNPGPQTPSPSPTVSPADHIQTPPSQFTTSTVITSETIQVSPMKQVSYYSIETNHCITSPIKTTSKRFRDHVKGRLDFDDTFTSDDNTESPSQPDAFDFDLPNLDCFGADFNFTDLLGDIDLDADYFGHPDNGSSPEPLSGSPDTMVDDSAGEHELLSGMSSTLTEIRSEQGINAAGPNSVTSVKSITKCIKLKTEIHEDQM
ncbi:hypothetical protein M8C21_004803, partial [Ambrosia artemisiifolia]